MGFRLCRSPYGERGLKSRSIEIFSQKVCRSPYGERGLKFRQAAGEGSHRESLSLRRAWIEMRFWPVMGAFVRVALLTESVD